MSVAHHSLLASHSGPESWVARAGAVIAGLVREWQVRQDLRSLESLDACALHDIGLAPGGLEGAVRYGRRGRLAAPVAHSPLSHLMPASWTEWR